MPLLLAIPKRNVTPAMSTRMLTGKPSRIFATGRPASPYTHGNGGGKHDDPEVNVAEGRNGEHCDENSDCKHGSSHAFGLRV